MTLDAYLRKYKDDLTTEMALDLIDMVKFIQAETVEQIRIRDSSTQFEPGYFLDHE